jgi:tetratricopeptide (TPR) repeat protein
MEVIATLEEEGISKFHARRYSRAFAVFKSILVQSPDNLTAHFHLALLYLVRSDYTSALAHAKKVIDLRPSELNAHLNLGCIYERSGRVDLAIRAYRKELEKNPGCAQAHYNLGEIYFVRKKFKLAALHWEKCLRLNHSVEEIYKRLVFCLNRIRDVQREIEVYQHYLQTHPKDVWTIENLGAAFIDAGDFKRSLYFLKKAKSLEPNHPVIDRNIKMALRAIRDD